MMKRYNYIIACLLGLFLFNACDDENLAKKGGTVEEGIPVDLKISFASFELNEIQTKADMGAESESTVYNLYLFIFNKKKQLEYMEKFDGLEKMSKEIRLTKTVTSGEKYIAAIANYNSDNIQLDIEGVNELSDLQGLTLNLNGDIIQRAASNGFAMSGYCGTDLAESQSLEGKCAITPDGVCITSSSVGSTPVEAKIYLKNVDAKIKFDVQVEGANREFIPKDWKVVNVPLTSYVLEKSSGIDAESKYFPTTETKFETMLIDNARYKGGQFSFYMMENRKNPKVTPVPDYNKREFKTEDGGKPDEPYFYANDNSTYVVLRGSYYEYRENGEIAKSADVRYTIHMGYVNGVTESEKASDFNSRRNLYYNYKVRISGVDKVELEVTTSQPGGGPVKEEQPGAEGSIIVSDQNKLFDAHYEVQTVTFYQDKLDNLSVTVKTPYESRTIGNLNSAYFEINQETGEATDFLHDFKWIKFAKNENASTKFMSYEDAYNGAKLQDVKEVLHDLWMHNKKNDPDNTGNFWTKSGNTRKVVYTVFVDEYYYDKDPVSNGATTWKKFVNAENRQMHILCDTKYSLDGQSSLTKSNIMLNQRSIKTIYNKNLSDSELATAWGIETISEDERLEVFRDKNNNWIYEKKTKTNGRYNTFLWLNRTNNAKGKKWENYVDFSTNKNKSDVYAQYACFHRNRDLNGNGTIDPYEVRWYLPATNQYVGLWIGQDALPSEARLLQKQISDVTSTNRLENHLISSNGVRFWVEEGVSTGSDSQSDNKFNVRCARNLGTKFNYANQNEEKPSSPTTGEALDYVIPTIKDKVVTAIDLSRVDPNALRSSPLSSLDLHGEHTFGILNYPYSSFKVSDTTSAKISVKKENGVIKKEALSSDCVKDYGAGYRIPNQREIALIAGYSSKDISGIGACTYSELSYKTSVYNVSYNGDGAFNFLTLNGKSGSVTNSTRCVKDGK